MEFVKIPVPDFSFFEIAKDLADEVCNDELDVDGITMYFGMEQLDDSIKVKLELQRTFMKLSGKDEQIIYLSFILNYLNDLCDKAPTLVNGRELPYFLKNINKAKYFFYGQAKSIGYEFDRNTFSIDEVKLLKANVDAVVEKINQLQAERNLYFSEIEEFKSDIESLKQDVILGKKRWYQRAGGIFLTYVGEKGADEVYAYLRPSIIALLTVHAPQILETIKGLLGK